LKVERIETLIVDAKSRPCVYVEIHTDEGLLGVGEASQSRGDRGVAEQVDALATRIVGRSPLELIESLSWVLLRDSFAGRIRYAAFSGVEQALWDLCGKALNVPCYRLFGGPVRAAVPLYANIATAIGSQEPHAWALASQRAVEDGFTAIKIYPLGGPDRRPDPGMPLEKEWVELAVARVRAVREAVGPDVRILTDWAWNLNDQETRRMAERLENYDLFWIEEPLHGTDPHALAALRRSLRPRLAGGEQLQGRRAFLRLLEAESLDVIMPDVKWVGGMSEFRKIAAVAEAKGIEISPHNMSGPVATAASVQLAASIGGCMLLEYRYADGPLRAELVRGTEVVEKGQIPLSQRPGLGIDWDPEVARRYLLS
jgi:galactonate dehydratase